MTAGPTSDPAPGPAPGPVDAPPRADPEPDRAPAASGRALREGAPARSSAAETALIREAAPADAPAAPARGDTAPPDGSALRGLVVGLPLSLLLWIAIGLLLRALLS